MSDTMTPDETTAVADAFVAAIGAGDVEQVLAI